MEMVLDEGDCLNSALDAMKDWNTALRGHLGPDALIVLEEILNTSPPSPGPDSEGPKP